jgi:hypothetical protein
MGGGEAKRASPPLQWSPTLVCISPKPPSLAWPKAHPSKSFAPRKAPVRPCPNSDHTAREPFPDRRPQVLTTHVDGRLVLIPTLLSNEAKTFFASFSSCEASLRSRSAPLSYVFPLLSMGYRGMQAPELLARSLLHFPTRWPSSRRWVSDARSTE